MSDQSPQPDPKEATEAKLCAYLEGDLSPSEKIEIERHLTAHPQHRQLLADLARTRDWMRSVPRENSPVELGEVFQGHVERQMLLDDSTDPSQGMSINRWPQYVLVAAITMLTLGLGAVLFAILKSPAGGTAMNTGPGVSPGSVDRSFTSTTMPLESRETKPLADAGPKDPDASRAIAGKIKGASEVDTLKARLDAAGIRLPVDQKTVCFVVTADSPPAAMDHVRGFFDRHQIAFNGPAGNRPSFVRAGVGHDGGVSFGTGLLQNDRPAELQQLGAGGQNNSNNQLVQNGQQSAPGDPNPDASSNAANAAKNAAPDAIDNNRQNQAQTPPTQTIFIAPSVTPLDLELLNASLASEALKQSVERVTLAERPQPSSPALQGTIARGATMTVIIPQLVAPGIDKTNVVKVGEDGTINLPMIDPVTAEGITPEELQKRIADRYREANLIEAATVTVAMAAAPSMSSAASRPTVKAAFGDPATQPSDPSFVEVVVVIQPSKLPGVGTPIAPGK